MMRLLLLLALALILLAAAAFLWLAPGDSEGSLEGAPRSENTREESPDEGLVPRRDKEDLTEPSTESAQPQVSPTPVSDGDRTIHILDDSRTPVPSIRVIGRSTSGEIVLDEETSSSGVITVSESFQRKLMVYCRRPGGPITAHAVDWLQGHQRVDVILPTTGTITGRVRVIGESPRRPIKVTFVPEDSSWIAPSNMPPGVLELFGGWPARSALSCLLDSSGSFTFHVLAAATGTLGFGRRFKRSDPGPREVRAGDVLEITLEWRRIFLGTAVIPEGNENYSFSIVYNPDLGSRGRSNVRPGPLVFEQPEGVESIELFFTLKSGASQSFTFEGPFDPVHRLGELEVEDDGGRTVVVKVVDASQRRPIAGAFVHFGMESLVTDGDGLVNVTIPTAPRRESPSIIWGARKIVAGAKGLEGKVVAVPESDSVEVALGRSADLDVIIRGHDGGRPPAGVQLRMKPSLIDLDLFGLQSLLGGYVGTTSTNMEQSLVAVPEDGVMAFRSMKPGETRLDLVGPFEEPLCDAVSVQIERGVSRKVDLSLSDPLDDTLTVLVLDDNGRPVQGAEINLTAQGAERSLTRYTDDAGQASIWLGLTDEVDLAISADGYESVNQSSVTATQETHRVTLTPN